MAKKQKAEETSTPVYDKWLDGELPEDAVLIATGYVAEDQKFVASATVKDVDYVAYQIRKPGEPQPQPYRGSDPVRPKPEFITVP